MSFVGLRPDADCFADAVHLSTGPYRYQVAPRVIREPGCPISECNTQFFPGGRQADVLSFLYNSNPTRVYERGRPSTQLYGTAPLKRMGDGVMHAVDTSNALRDGYGVPMRCVRPEEDMTWRHFFDYIDMPNNVEEWRRGGVSTRFQPVAISPVRAATPVPVQHVA